MMAIRKPTSITSMTTVEGETPAEDAAALLTEAGEVLGQLESLIRRINRTNAAIQVEGGTLTDALARRDVLRMRHAVVTSAANAAAGDGQRGFRQLRSELKMLPALPVAELRLRIWWELPATSFRTRDRCGGTPESQPTCAELVAYLLVLLEHRPDLGWINFSGWSMR
jgi:hypothetical protein